MNINSTFLFILLLAILVISVVFSRYLPITHEGFVQFSANTKPIDFVVIPQYNKNSTKVAKVFDNIFFDTINGNLIEVVGSGEIGANVSMSSNVDTTGSTIQNIYVVKRDGNTSSSPYTTRYGTNNEILSNDVAESKINSIQTSYNVINYSANHSDYEDYAVIYVPWDKTTLVHVLQTSPPANSSLITLFSSELYESVNVNHGNITFTNSSTTVQNNANNGKMIKETEYDAEMLVYQINDNVKFSVKNGDLIIGSGSSITVYDRNNNLVSSPKTSKSTGLANMQFGGWVVSDKSGNMVVYIYMGMKTVIYIVKQINGTLRADSAYRFNPTGIETQNGAVLFENATSTQFDPSGATVNSEYYKWLAYWNTYSSTLTSDKIMSEDYLLKTQIVPPVCPSCPSCSSCSSGGTCSNCGNNGGSGTLGKDGKSLINGNASSSSSSVRNNVARGGELNNLIDESADLLRSGSSGATNLLKSGVSGAVDLTKSGVTGAVDLTKSGVTGAVDLAKSGVTGAVGLLRDTGSGVRDILTQNSGSRYSSSSSVPVQQREMSYGNSPSYGNNSSAAGSSSSIINKYNYGGSLPDRGSSDFIPMTADFSKFGR